MAFFYFLSCRTRNNSWWRPSLSWHLCFFLSCCGSFWFVDLYTFWGRCNFSILTGLDWCVRVYPANEQICQLELRFDEFRVQKPDDADEECTKDYLEIFDNTNTVEKPKRFCQPFTGIRVVDIVSTSFKTFHFVSDEAISDVGFSIFIRQKPCEEIIITTTNAPVDGRTSVSTNGKSIV